MLPAICNALNEFGNVQCVVGDLNLRLGATSMDTVMYPFSPAATFLQQMRRLSLQWIPLSQSTRPDRIQHLFTGSAIIPFQCKRLPMIYQPGTTHDASNHPPMLFRLRLPPDVIPTSAPHAWPDPSQEQSDFDPEHQFNLQFLNHEPTLDRMNRALDLATLALPTIDETIALLEECASDHPDVFDSFCSLLIDWLSESVNSTLTMSASRFLGTYRISERTQSNTRTDLAFLHRHGRSAAGLRLFRQSCNQTQTPLLPSSPDVPLEEEIIEHYSQMYRFRVSDMLPPLDVLPERSELLEWYRQQIQGNVLPSPHPQAFIPITAIESSISDYPTNKARGVDGISPRLFKALDSISSPLHLLFNACVLTGRTPTDWNTALVIPIPKAGSEPEFIQNRRPISVTPLSRRIFEKAFMRSMQGMTEERAKFVGPTAENSTFSPCQSGFIRGQSTLAPTLQIHESMLRCPSDLILLDLKSAYDRVDPQRLLQKLHSRGLPFIFRNLVRSLYSGGRGKAWINGQLSQHEFTRFSGLLQGALWSPMLFNFFIDDLPDRIPSNPSYITRPIKLYADDIALTRPLSDRLQLARDILEVAAWCSENGLEINWKKCVWIAADDSTPLSLQNFFSLPHFSSLFPTSLCLPRASSFSYLGFPLGRAGLQFPHICRRGTCKALEVLEICRAAGGHWPPLVRLSIFKAFIRSQFEYGLALIGQMSAFGPIPDDISRSISDTEQVYMDSVRWILDLPRRARLDVSHYGVLGLATFEERLSETITRTAQQVETLATPESELLSVRKKINMLGPPPTRSLLYRFSQNPMLREYRRSSTRWTDTPPNQVHSWHAAHTQVYSWDPALSNGHGPPEPPSIKWHIAATRIVSNSRKSVLLACIDDDTRSPRTIGFDSTLLIPAPRIRHHAIKWRTNSFGHYFRCPFHGQNFTRRCVSECPVFHDWPKWTPELCAEFELSRSQFTECRNKQDILLPDSYNILDFLLNTNQWLLFGEAVLHLFRTCTLVNYRGSVDPVDTLESELSRLTTHNSWNRFSSLAEDHRDVPLPLPPDPH